MFSLNKSFVNKYRDIKPPFGYNGLGYVVYLRTYSRQKDDGSQEQWYETIERVVNGCFSMQEDHCNKNGIPFSIEKANILAEEMYDSMFNMRFLPPGRGLASMDYNMLSQKNTYAALNNCSFVSTEDIDDDPIYPFTFMMDMSMLGVGVGFDTRGAGKIKIPNKSLLTPLHYTLQIADSREGWVFALRCLLEYHFGLTSNKPEFDYSAIRKEGEPIKGFGGVSSGYKPLKKMLDLIGELLLIYQGHKIDSRLITDIMNLIGVCVVSGNVRRSSQIALGDPNDDGFLQLKDYSIFPERALYGWTSNNTVIVDQFSDYEKLAKQTTTNGEPGYFWLDNAINYGRMKDKPNAKDKYAKGTNPCGEQTLEDGEVCCLVEVFPSRISNITEFKETLKLAFLYAKTVTLGKTGYKKTDKIIERNRRIGTSVTGIATFLNNRSVKQLKNWLDEGYDAVQYYDEIYSKWLKVNKSIKTTSVKPSGTVSLLAGVTPGIKFPESNYYIRRVRIAENSPLVKALRKANYTVEPAINEVNTVVVEFPIYEESKRIVSNTPAYTQLRLAFLLQKYWSDNQVSCTITIKDDEYDHLPTMLRECSSKLKSVSFLPFFDVAKTTYKQLPYEPIDEVTYRDRVSQLKELDFHLSNTRDSEDQFCDGDKCML